MPIMLPPKGAEWWCPWWYRVGSVAGTTGSPAFLQDLGLGLIQRLRRSVNGQQETPQPCVHDKRCGPMVNRTTRSTNLWHCALLFALRNLTATAHIWQRERSVTYKCCTWQKLLSLSHCLDECTVCLPLYGLAPFVNNTSNTVQNNSVRAKLSGQHSLITLARADLAFSALLDM